VAVTIILINRLKSSLSKGMRQVSFKQILMWVKNRGEKSRLIVLFMKKMVKRIEDKYD